MTEAEQKPTLQDVYTELLDNFGFSESLYSGMRVSFSGPILLLTGTILDVKRQVTLSEEGLSKMKVDAKEVAITLRTILVQRIEDEINEMLKRWVKQYSK